MIKCVSRKPCIAVYVKCLVWQAQTRHIQKTNHVYKNCNDVQRKLFFQKQNQMRVYLTCLVC